jgi:hypothetical protein
MKSEPLGYRSITSAFDPLGIPSQASERAAFSSCETFAIRHAANESWSMHRGCPGDVFKLSAKTALDIEIKPAITHAVLCHFMCSSLRPIPEPLKSGTRRALAADVRAALNGAYEEASRVG